MFLKLSRPDFRNLNLESVDLIHNIFFIFVRITLKIRFGSIQPRKGPKHRGTSLSRNLIQLAIVMLSFKRNPRWSHADFGAVASGRDCADTTTMVSCSKLLCWPLTSVTDISVAKVSAFTPNRTTFGCCPQFYSGGRWLAYFGLVWVTYSRLLSSLKNSIRNSIQEC